MDDADAGNELHRPRAGHQRGGGRRLDVRREPDLQIGVRSLPAAPAGRGHVHTGQRGVPHRLVTDGSGGAPPAPLSHTFDRRCRVTRCRRYRYGGRRHGSGADVGQRRRRSRCRIGEDRGHVYRLQPERRPPDEHFAVGRSDWENDPRARSAGIWDVAFRLHAASREQHGLHLRKRPRRWGRPRARGSS